MDADVEKLTMVNREKASTEICPKCNSGYQAGTNECPSCGVIFKKLKSSTNGSHADTRAIPAPAPAPGNQKVSNIFDKRKKTYVLLIFLCIFGVGFYSLYVTWIESRIQARGFQKQLIEFCSLEISDVHLNHVAEGEDPFRTGKVLVVSERQEVTLMNTATGQPFTMVQEEGIHPVWHMLNRKIRAKEPSDVDTLIRVHKKIGKAGRYGKLKTKVFSTNKIVLDVYDWKNQTFIGTKVLDPGQGSTFMTEEDYDAMKESVSDKAIAEYIQSMDIRE